MSRSAWVSVPAFTIAAAVRSHTFRASLLRCFGRSGAPSVARAGPTFPATGEPAGIGRILY